MRGRHKDMFAVLNIETVGLSLCQAELLFQIRTSQLMRAFGTREGIPPLTASWSQYSVVVVYTVH